MQRRVMVVAVLAFGTLGACGGGGVATTSGPVAASTPTPVPAATPTPVPAPTPTPCTQGLCEDPVTNTAPAVSCATRLYWVRRPGTNQIYSDCREDDIPVGWLFALDTTCRDRDRKPTNSTSNTSMRWEGTDRLLDCNRRGPFQIWCSGIEAGHFQAQFQLFNADGGEVRAVWLHGDLVPEEDSKCGK